MTIWYRVDDYSSRITPVEVERSTTNSVWINGHRKAKHSRHEIYFETYCRAVDYVRERNFLRPLATMKLQHRELPCKIKMLEHRLAEFDKEINYGEQNKNAA